MKRRRFVFSCFSLVAALSLFASTPADAQNGVRVDADGVLRTLVFLDPTGALTRRRIAEARAKLNADVMRPSNLRKVSINRLVYHAVFLARLLPLNYHRFHTLGQR